MDNSTIALVGNPNSGKTTFFNALTGSNHRVGNWPGVTVEKKEGNFNYKNQEYNVIDLPGIYSLGAFSEDEVVARDYILTGDADIIINVVDANNIERNLYLTTQLLEMGKKVVIALNMVDEAEKKNIKFDLIAMSEKLGLPVVPTIASREKGIDDVIEASIKLIDNKIDLSNPIKYSEIINHHIDHIKEILSNETLPYSTDWIAIKIVEGDKNILEKLKSFNLSKNTLEKIEEFIKYHSSEDFELEIIDSRYAFANSITRDTVTKPINQNETNSDKIDKIITNKYLGIPIFALIMLVVFQLTFSIGQELLGGLAVDLFGKLGEIIESLLITISAPQWLISFFNEGLMEGVGTVVEFVPLITVLYLLLGLLEDSGYMSRVAYVWDNLMRKLGLQGKAFVSMIIGFGCNVPGIMSARTMDNKKDRMITTLINPFMSCGAKIPIYSIFIAAFFPNHGGLILFSLYALGIVIGLIMAKVFSKTLFKGESSYFIMELPPYRIPTFKNVLRNMWDNVSGFLKRAGTIILIVISLLWILAVVPTSADPYSEFTILGKIGKFIAPIFKPAGFGNWQASVALFGGLPAKEAVIGTLGMLYSGEYVEGGRVLVNAIQQHFTPLSAISYMVMTLLYTPCAAVLGTVKKETNSIKWTLFIALYTFAIAWVASVLVFQVGSLLGFS